MRITTSARSFEMDMQAYADRLEKDLSFVVRSIAFQIFRLVVKGTPVDTGRARANWNIAINEIDLTVDESVAAGKTPGKHEGQPSAAASASLQKLRGFGKYQLGDVIVISNSVSYIAYLEDGTPNMAPFNMVKNAFAAMRAFVIDSLSE